MVALDLRYHKSPYSDVDGDFLGEAQWAWLAETLQSAKEDAVVVVSSLQVLDERYGMGERWGRFPAARRRLLKVLESCRKPLLVVSGDVHMAELSKSEMRQPDADRLHVERHDARLEPSDASRLLEGLRPCINCGHGVVSIDSAARVAGC